MAEVVGVLGLIASILGIIEGIDKSKTIIKKYIHTSSSLRAELVPLLGKLTAFAGLLRGLQLECELDDSDDGRLQILAHIREPLEHSKRAAEVIVTRLEQIFTIGGISLSFGKIFNKETSSALHMLDQAKSVLDLALAADQRTLLKSIETYLRNVTQDVCIIREESRIHYQDLKEDLRSIKANNAETVRIHDRTKLLEWVSPVKSSTNYHAALLPTLEEDTSGDWFFNGQTFKSWKSSPVCRGIILTGISGAGKTVLCSKVIRHILQENPTCTRSSSLAYFFFDFNDVGKQTVEGMVRSLIAQLIPQLHSIPVQLQTQYSEHCSSPSAAPTLPLQHWCDILKLCLQSASAGHIFIDALDECGEAESRLLTETLHALVCETDTPIKWFLTCRPAGFESDFKDVDFVPSIMGTELVDGDIQHYLSARLKKDPRLASFGPLAKELIVSQITAKSQGMFRFAQCQLESLAKLRDRRLIKVKEVLEAMPTDIESTYKRILLDLQKSNDRVIFQRILILVCYSARPVSLAEVAEFVILEDDMTTVGPEDRMEDITEMISVLSTFVAVQDGNLILAHKSVQDYMANINLEEPPTWTDGSAVEYLARRCLQYLAFSQQPASPLEAMRRLRNPNAQNLAKLLVRWPFLDFAASRWPYYVQDKVLQERLAVQMRLVLPFTVEANLWKAWLMLQRVDIWETQLQVARLLCEAMIRSAVIGGWAFGFWQVRQQYRITSFFQKPESDALRGRNYEEIPKATDWFRTFLANTEAALSNLQGSEETHAKPAKPGKLDPLVDDEMIELEIGTYVRASYSQTSDLPRDQLSFLAGDWILVVDKQDEHIWKGSLNGSTGYFSSKLVAVEPQVSDRLSGLLYYELVAVLSEIALQRSLSLDLKWLLAKVSSREGLRVLHTNLNISVLERAAATMGDQYGKVLKSALSKVRFSEIESCPSYLAQEYVLRSVHLPLQLMMASGFRASRSSVGILIRRRGPATASYLTEYPPGKSRGRLDVYTTKSAGVVRDFPPPPRPSRAYELTQEEYVSGCFSAPQHRAQDAFEQRIVTTASYADYERPRSYIPVAYRPENPWDRSTFKHTMLSAYYREENDPGSYLSSYSPMLSKNADTRDVEDISGLRRSAIAYDPFPDPGIRARIRQAQRAAGIPEDRIV